MKCPNCKKTKVNFFLKAKNIHGSTLLNKDEFSLFKCQLCGFIFPEINISPEYYQKYYQENYYNRKPGLIGLLQKIYLVFARMSLQKSLASLVNKGKILDYGCGNGDFLAHLPDNIEKYGIEINTHAVKFISQTYPQIKIFNNVEQLPKKIKFDLISLWHVIEHIENAGILIKKLTEKLSENGYIIIATPNTNSWGFSLCKEYWFHLDAPRHIALYNHDNLLAMCKNSGLDLVTNNRCKTDYPFDVFWSLFNKFKKNNLLYDFILLFFIFPSAFIIKIISFIMPERSEIMTLLFIKKS